MPEISASFLKLIIVPEALRVSFVLERGQF